MRVIYCLNYAFIGLTLREHCTHDPCQTQQNTGFGETRQFLTFLFLRTHKSWREWKKNDPWTDQSQIKILFISTVWLIDSKSSCKINYHTHTHTVSVTWENFSQICNSIASTMVEFVGHTVMYSVDQNQIFPYVWGPIHNRKRWNKAHYKISLTPKFCEKHFHEERRGTTFILECSTSTDVCDVFCCPQTFDQTL